MEVGTQLGSHDVGDALARDVHTGDLSLLQGLPKLCSTSLSPLPLSTSTPLTSQPPRCS